MGLVGFFLGVFFGDPLMRALDCMPQPPELYIATPIRNNKPHNFSELLRALQTCSRPLRDSPQGPWGILLFSCVCSFCNSFEILFRCSLDALNFRCPKRQTPKSTKTPMSYDGFFRTLRKTGLDSWSCLFSGFWRSATCRIGLNLLRLPDNGMLSSSDCGLLEQGTPGSNPVYLSDQNWAGGGGGLVSTFTRGTLD